MKMIKRNAQNTFSDDVIDSYMNLFEEVITSQTLREYFKNVIKEKKQIIFKKNLIQNYKLEYGYFD